MVTYAQQRLRGRALPTEEIFLQCGHFARVLNLSSIHRNVFPQCPHTTLVPSGWTGSAGWAGCSSEMSIMGPRLIMRRQLGLGHPIRRDVSLQMRRQLQGHLTYFFPVGGVLIGVASLQTVHLTTCWWSLPSRLMSDWHTRQLMTGIPLVPGLAMAVYGGGSSALGLLSCKYGGAVGVTLPEWDADSRGERSSIPSAAMTAATAQRGGPRVELGCG